MGRDSTLCTCVCAQMALQLAFYRMHGEHTATYESAQTVMFRHGRTETIRTLTVHSIAFVAAMTAEPRDDQTCARALAKATAAHAEYTKRASTGQAIDRHLLGLRILAAQAGLKPDVFSDPVFAKNNTFRLSTSTVPDTCVSLCPVLTCGGDSACMRADTTPSKALGLHARMAMVCATPSTGAWCQRTHPSHITLVSTSTETRTSP